MSHSGRVLRPLVEVLRADSRACAQKDSVPPTLSTQSGRSGVGAQGRVGVAWHAGRVSEPFYLFPTLLLTGIGSNRCEDPGTEGNDAGVGACR